MTVERVEEGSLSVPYEPSSEYLERYADLLINYALGGGAGIKRGDVVHVIAPESAKPLYAELCRAIWRAGGQVLADFRPDGEATNSDYGKLLGILKEVKYPGAVSIEWEGKGDSVEGVKKTRDLILKHWPELPNG